MLFDRFGISVFLYLLLLLLLLLILELFNGSYCFLFGFTSFLGVRFGGYLVSSGVFVCYFYFLGGDLGRAGYLDSYGFFFSSGYFFGYVGGFGYGYDLVYSYRDCGHFSGDFDFLGSGYFLYVY